MGALTKRRSQRDQTPDQYLVDRILKNKDNYYGVFEAKPDVDISIIKKRFRSWSRKIHPDVCKAKGANDAFISINNAYSCLSDPKRRRAYDNTGLDWDTTTSNRPMLVNGHKPYKPVQYTGDQSGSSIGLFVGFFCFVFVTAILVWLSIPSSKSCISLTSGFGFAEKRTHELPNGRSVDYYLKDPCGIMDKNVLEHKVRQMYVSNLESQCHDAKQKIGTLSKQALVAIPSCKEIFELRAYI